MAVRASGTGNYLKRTETLSTSDAITQCVWAKRKVDTNGYATVSYTHCSGGPLEMWLECDTSGDLLHFYELRNYSEVMCVGPTLTLDTWFFVMITRTASGRALYYGTEAGGTLTKVTESSTGRDVTNPINDWWYFDDLYGEGFNGELAYGRIWLRAFSDAEAEAEWQSATPVITSNLVADYRFVDSAGATTDSSGNGRTLTKTGTITTGGADPVPPGGSPPAAAPRLMLMGVG